MFKQTNLIDLKERIALADCFTPEERHFILAAVNAAVDAVALLRNPPTQGAVGTAEAEIAQAKPGEKKFKQ